MTPGRGADGTWQPEALKDPATGRKPWLVIAGGWDWIGAASALVVRFVGAKQSTEPRQSTGTRCTGRK